MSLAGQRAVVVVVGDVGRSPRTQYQALSLAEAGAEVTLVGYAGAACFASVAEHPRVRVRRVTPLVGGLPQTRWLYLALAPVKFVVLLVQLLVVLVALVGRQELVLTQNPPAIPTLLVVRVYAWLYGVRHVVDWHNFGYSLMALSLSREHRIVRWARAYEQRFGRMADAHLCVTAAMQRELSEVWGIRAAVLYDRPPAHFCPTPLPVRHDLFRRLADQLPSRLLLDLAGQESLLCEAGGGALREDRPVVIVSSTSWTADEDFSILLEAAVLVNERAKRAATKHGQRFPRVLFVITGKGPLKAYYEEKMSMLRSEYVFFATMWLAPEDYPRLIGSADLGISLHTSSSGLDLPMKVVDMFGCGLPVCAIRFSCIDELVVHGKNGLVFENSFDLAQQLTRLLGGFPHNTEELDAMRREVEVFRRLSWADNWREAALPTFEARR